MLKVQADSYPKTVAIKYSGFRIEGRIRQRQDQLVLMMVLIFPFTPTGQKIIHLKVKTEKKAKNPNRTSKLWASVSRHIVASLYYGNICYE